MYKHKLKPYKDTHTTPKPLTTKINTYLPHPMAAMSHNIHTTTTPSTSTTTQTLTTESYDRALYNNADHYERNKPKRRSWAPPRPTTTITTTTTAATTTTTSTTTTTPYTPITDNNILVDGDNNTMHNIISRQRRYDNIDTRDMLHSDSISSDLVMDYKNLQIEVSSMIIKTIEDLRVNMVTQRRLKKYEGIKAQGKTTEFFKFEDIFKEVPNSTTTDTNHRPYIRNKRAAPVIALAAIAGVLGTFLGMYNTYEIQMLKARLNEMDKNHNLLVHVTQRQEEQIHRITENMNTICALIKLMTKINPALIAEQISAQLNLYESRVIMATNAVQQLQHRRLAVDLLDTIQLEEMHRAIEAVATERGYTLMPQRLSDYFQIETSYLRNGGDILIMLHVPCIVHDQLLTIYKYIPLPFPVPKIMQSDTTTILDLIEQRHNNFVNTSEQGMDALMLIPEAEMIAVGKTDQFQILTQGDLAGCIKRNKIHLCEKNQVLHTNLKTSCLGSIYSNYEPGIKENCKLERKNLQETVYQLSATDHLLIHPHTIYSKNQMYQWQHISNLHFKCIQNNHTRILFNQSKFPHNYFTF